jgi:hypothetical protein
MRLYIARLLGAALRSTVTWIGCPNNGYHVFMSALRNPDAFGQVNPEPRRGHDIL